MVIILDKLLHLFLKYRNAFALSYFTFGTTITYYLRDGLKLAPNSSVFTAALTVGPLFLCFPLSIQALKRLYVPNLPAYRMTFLSVGLAFLYLFIYVPNKWFTNVPYELACFFIIFYMYFIVQTMSIESLKETFTKMVLAITLIGSLCFIAYVIRDPRFILGARAGIKFGEYSDGATFTNPHLFARSGFGGMLAILIEYKYAKKFLYKIFLICCTIPFLVLLSLTLSMTTILSTVTVYGIYFVFSFTIHNILLTIYKVLKSFTFWLTLIGFIYLGSVIYSKFEDKIDNISQAIGGRAGRIVNTLLGVEETYSKNGKAPVSDASANARVENITVVMEEYSKALEEYDILHILFGYGYQKHYVDSPFFQALDDFGVIGFVLFLMFQFYLIRGVVLEMMNPRTPFTMFIAYGFVIIFVYSISGGLFIDFTRWGYYGIIARFLGITKFPKKAESAEQLQLSNV